MKQPGLFDGPPTWHSDPARRARRSDPETSKAAAVAAEPLVGAHQHAIVTWLRARTDERGRTKDEIAQGISIDSVAVARRMRDLATAGLVEEAGVGVLASGRPGTLWRAVRAPGSYATS